MTEDPLKIFEKLDPELLKLVERNNELAFAAGNFKYIKNER